MKSIMHYFPPKPKGTDVNARAPLLHDQIIPVPSALTRRISSANPNELLNSSDSETSDDEREKMSTRRETWKALDKKRIVETAVLRGPTAAAKDWDVSISNVYRWKAQLAQARKKAADDAREHQTGYLDPKLLDVFASKRRNCGRRGLPTTVEDSIASWFDYIRSTRNVVSRRRLKQIAMAAAKSAGQMKFKGSKEWCRSFMKRYRISNRKVTKVYSKDLDSPEEKLQAQRIYLARMAFVQNSYDIPADLIFHADETGLGAVS